MFASGVLLEGLGSHERSLTVLSRGHSPLLQNLGRSAPIAPAVQASKRASKSSTRNNHKQGSAILLVITLEIDAPMLLAPHLVSF